MNPPILRNLRAEELPLYRETGRKFFPAADWGHGMARVARLIARWPGGIKTVWAGETLLGYMTLWPLSPDTAGRLESGALSDDDIDEESTPADLGQPIENWIVTALAVVPPEKPVRRAAIELLLGELRRVREAGLATRIYAHAITANGHRFCLRTGFRFLFPKVPALCVLTRDRG